MTALLRRLLILIPSALVVAICSVAAAAEPPRVEPRPRQEEARRLPDSVPPGAAIPAPLSSIHSVSSFKSAGPDTIWIYGGPGSPLGKFGTTDQPDPQGWTGRDLSDVGVLWQRSTFQADSFGNSPDNHVLWAGFDAQQKPGWVTAPGYGNNWNGIAEYRRQVADPTQGQTVQLSFRFNHDVEPGYDYFHVEYDSAGVTLPVYSVSDTNKDASGFFTPLDFPADITPLRNIIYAGNDYSGPDSDEIVIRLRVTSDGAWSDEDGLYASDGAAQVDDVVVTSSEGIDVEDFEAESDWLWTPLRVPFMGDFAKIFALLTDPDPCRDNPTPQWTFIDDGTPPSNAPGQSTGGTLASFPFSDPFGVPGGYGVNGTGGLLNLPFTSVPNDIVSSPILFDHPSTWDDGPNIRTFLKFTVMDWWYGNQPGYSVFVESSLDGQTWRRRDSLFSNYSSSLFGYTDVDWDLSWFLEEWPSDPTWIRVGVHVLDGALYQQLAARSPGPFFDNFSVYKVPAGHELRQSTQAVFDDAFPLHHPWQVDTAMARDLLDIRVDGGPSWSGRDSCVLYVSPIHSSTVIQASDVKMKWVLDKNPLFEDAIRSAPPNTTVIAGGAANGWDQWTGEVLGNFSLPNSTSLVYFDLPDENFFYPGDVIRYYFEAVDANGFVTTLPANTFGFLSGEVWPEAFTVRGLPTFLDNSGAIPPVLAIGYDTGEWDAGWQQAFDQLGWQLGVDYDRFTQRPFVDQARQGLVGLGINPLNAVEIAGYHAMLVRYRRGPGYGMESAGEFQLHRNWTALPGSRSFVQFQPHNSCSDEVWLEGLPISSTCNDLQHTIPARSPLALAQSPLTTDFVLRRECSLYLWPRGQQLIPGLGAVAGHYFEDPAGSGVPRSDFPASIIYDRLDGVGDRKRDVVVPLDLDSVANPPGHSGPLTARSQLLLELLGDAAPIPVNPPVAAEEAPSANIDFRVSPNPFNATTQLHFYNPHNQRVRLTIYDAAGRRVRALVDGELAAGPQEILWRGRDDGGGSVASGVYYAQLRLGGERQTLKIALVE